MFSYQVNGFFFDRAFDLQKESSRFEHKQQFFLSWAFSTGSRICFLMDFIEDIVTIPFATLAIAFSSIVAHTNFTKNGLHFLEQKFNHLTLSFLGLTISPWLVVEKIGSN